MGSALSARDYERMLDLAVFLIETGEPAAGTRAIADELSQSLRANFSVFVDQIRPPTSGSLRTVGRPTDHNRAMMESRMAKTVGSCPLPQHYASTEDREPLTATDVARRASWHRTHAYHSIRTRSGDIHELCLPLRAPTGMIRTFLFFSQPGEIFTERDLTYAKRVQPLLVSIDNHLRHLQLWARRFPEDAQPLDRMKAATCPLTPRELTVLQLLADGLTATAIGHRLSRSPQTAVKHKENLYRKLDTRDRLSTVVRAQALGLLTPTPKLESFVVGEIP